MADSEIIVAAAALIVSVIAFAATLMQCLQQYYASARGYSQCNEKVMGKWAQTKQRRFSLEELRFEVQFDAPVIFVCPPTNIHGPVKDATIYNLDGSQTSLDETWTTLRMNQREDYHERSPKDRIHTSDNERASWVILLSAVQNMENESRDWHLDQFGYNHDEPPTASFKEYGLPTEPPGIRESHTLMVALQRKRKSWDTIPSSIQKPYATTTMCHLVEMIAAMGIYWKEFNRRNDRYRAEGNGFMVLGERNSDLGLLFSFQVNGRSQFKRNRVIPVDEIKELCFGWVPTIYRSNQDKRRLEVPIDVLDLSSLQMGTRGEIAETLVMIGCNNNAVSHFLEEGRRTSHLFPISFEILGMLSQTFHIKNTYFTYIPNPTPDRWDRVSVSLTKMMESFQNLFVKDLPEGHRNRRIVSRLSERMDAILELQDDETVQKLRRYKALHAALDDADEILTGRIKPSRKKPNKPAEPQRENTMSTSTSDPTAPSLRRRMTAMIGLQNRPAPAPAPTASKTQRMEDPSPGLSSETDAQRERREQVQDVLRSHIQEVLRQLNEREDRYSDQTMLSPQQQRWPRLHQRSRSTSPAPPFVSTDPTTRGTTTMDDVDMAGPDDRQDFLMRLYCQHIRKQVVGIANDSAKNRRMSQSQSRRGSMASPPASPTRRDFAVPMSPSQSTPPLADGQIPLSDMAPAKTARIDTSAEYSGDTMTSPGGNLADEPVSHDDIWCTLVFRMICWLMLHDFNKLDVQVPKSELLGSRMPVYVA